MIYSQDPEHHALLDRCLNHHQISVCFTPEVLPNHQRWVYNYRTLTLTWTKHADVQAFNASIRECLAKVLEDPNPLGDNRTD